MSTVSCIGMDFAPLVFVGTSWGQMVARPCLCTANLTTISRRDVSTVLEGTCWLRASVSPKVLSSMDALIRLRINPFV